MTSLMLHRCRTGAINLQSTDNNLYSRHDSHRSFQQFCSLFRCNVTSLMPPDRSMSTLKRIKTYLRNTMTNERLSCLSTIAIEKKLVKELISDQMFKDRVIDNFATKKTAVWNYCKKIRGIRRIRNQCFRQRFLDSRMDDKSFSTE
ncbi:hypothetical protein ANN_15253 [Periplaneta americana]|uniref:Uncharacterized protein n=1 Tax=Periplaneta americana TaxID=6978 RepID=A0ABQ8SH16_PERAM|nr:hypothetical protein ANN_15253 [Periplaneta americana]